MISPTLHLTEQETRHRESKEQPTDTQCHGARVHHALDSKGSCANSAPGQGTAVGKAHKFIAAWKLHVHVITTVCPFNRKVKVTLSCLTPRPCGLYSPWNSPDQNTGVGSLSLLQGNLPNPGTEPRSPALQADSLPAEPQGKPI